jgi:hypothetical protein
MSGAAAAAAATAAAAAAATTASRSEIKIKTPENFDGRPEHVNRWLGSVKRYLDINSHIYFDDDRKVLFALSYMQSGPAESWVEDFTNDTATIVTSGQAKGYGNFATFTQLVKNDFGPANATASAAVRRKTPDDETPETSKVEEISNEEILMKTKITEDWIFKEKGYFNVSTF